jgi:hypothetical protein
MNDGTFIPEHCRARVIAMRDRLLQIGDERPWVGDLAERPTWVVSIEAARCAVLIDDLFDGFEHLPDRTALHRVDWSGSVVRLPLGAAHRIDLGTFHFALLTKLVVFAHAHVVLARIDARQVGGLALTLTACEPGEGEGQHPTIDELAREVTAAARVANGAADDLDSMEAR